MVKQPADRCFLSEESGATIAEGLIALPLVMLVFAAFIEFGYAMFQWNQTVKAVHYGARLAAVSTSVFDVADFDVVAAAAAPIADAGNTIPIAHDGPWTCGGDSGTACNSELNRIVYGSSASTDCQPVGTAGTRPAMCHLNWRIGLGNVLVTYELSGLGYYGRTQGAVVTIRMEVQDITFDLPILGALLGLDDVMIPAMPVTITSEDLDTTSGS